MPYYKRNLLALSVTIFITALSMQQVFPFLPLFLKELGAGRHIFEWSYAASIAASLSAIVAQPVWGKIADITGRKPMVIRAGIFLGAVTFGTAFCQTPLQVVISRFLNGALTGFIPASFALIATNTPPKQAPRYIAIVQSASAAGVIAGPAFGGVLAEILGYRASFRAAGAAVWVATILVWLLVKEPNKALASERTSLAQDLRISLQSRVMSSIMVAMLVAAVFGAAIGPVLLLHLGKLMPDARRWLLGLIFALPSAAFVMTAYGWTRLGEKWSYNRVIVLSLVGAGVVSMGLWFTGSIWTFGVLYFVAAAFMASISPATGSLIVLRVDENFRGRAYGLQNAAGILGGLLAMLAASKVASAYGTSAVFLMVAACLPVGAVAFVFALKKRGRKPIGDGGSVQA